MTDYLTVFLLGSRALGLPEPIRTIVSTKGQVILPKVIRDQQRWGAGTKLTAENVDGGVLLKRESLFAPTTIEEVAGMLKYDGPAKTIEEMDAAVMQEARRRARR